jgi:predicted CxxxxCH...CXXCH cytochrome family protein
MSVRNKHAKLFYFIFMVLMVAVACTGCKKTEKPYNHRSETWLNPIYNAGPGSHGGIVQKRGSTVLCALCHGRQLQGENGLPGCDTCHFGPDGSRTPDAAAWQHGIASHATRKSEGAVCNACHDLYRSYGLGPKTCHNCHEGSNAPHQAGQPWLDRKNADFHGASSLQCSSCHDQTTKCATCHFGPTGSKAPQGSSWEHGTIPHDNETLESNQAVCNQCHTLNRSYGNGPISCHDCHESDETPHAVPFAAHGASAKQDIVQCRQCHAQPTDGGPGSNLRFNTAVGSLPQGCESAGCHALSTAHPVPWRGVAAISHQSAQNMSGACALCHGASLEGGAGPACTSCHTGGSPLVAVSCTSCHAAPPASATYPDRKGVHDVHNALPGLANACSVCHFDAGSQTAKHYNGIPEVSMSGFNAKTGAAAYAAAGMTCSNVSCHGGIQTPRWDTGTIDINGPCSSCHTSSGQYNSYASGKHRKHVVDKNIACTECHDTTKLAAVHFSDLSTTAMPDAPLTLRDDMNYNGSSCSLTCHIGNEQHDAEETWR